MAPEIRTILAELRKGLEVIYGPRLVQMLLIGSHARGDAAPSSDIDVLIVLSGQVRPGEEIARTGAVTADISLQHDVVISCSFVSEERFQTGRSPFLLNARREGLAA